MRTRRFTIEYHVPTGMHTAADEAPRVVDLGKGATVWVAGSGDPLLLLHGWGLHHSVYSRGMALLSRRGFQVAAPSMGVVGRTWTIDRAVHRALKTFDALEWNDAVVVGNSLGGAVAISLAARHPERVRLLVLVNCVGLPLRRGNLGWALPFRRYVTAANLRAAGAFGRNLLAPAGALNLAGAAWYAKKAGLAAELESIRSHRVPAVVLWAERDRLLPLSMGRDVAEAIGAALRVVPRCDHDWTIRYPEHFAEELEVCINEGPRRRRGGLGPIERMMGKRRAARRTTASPG